MKGNFVRGQTNSKYHDRAPLTLFLYFRLIIISSHDIIFIILSVSCECYYTWTPSTRIRIFFNPQLFLSGYCFCSHVSGEFGSESEYFFYVWAGKFFNPERKSCGFKNIWIRADGAKTNLNPQLFVIRKGSCDLEFSFLRQFCVCVLAWHSNF